MLRSPQPSLPIEPCLPALRAALATARSAVLQAPPGAGKTTGVPLALLAEPWLVDRSIVMLEPRRLAARAAAQRMSKVLGESPGGTVGYRIRHDTRVGPGTRLEVVTEGVLTRMLLADPALERFALVIFDEFHERSLHADLGLALTLQTRALLREDLRILVMSATLDGAPVAALLGHAPLVTSEGRAFPVVTRHLPRRPEVRVEAAVASAVRKALVEESGDVLAFLPGAAEIGRARALLTDVSAAVIPLHGTLSRSDQDRALRASPAGRRKVVLASSIAETSLTIDGVRVVVDGGLARVPRYSPRSGMTRLATMRVSRASADQRRGRAGRQAPGVCYRLWSAQEDAVLLPRATPEILEADLAPLALELAAAGVKDPLDLAWLDAPPVPALAEARSLLAQLGLLDANGRITAHGRHLTRFALHPRLAHMVVRGRALGVGALACELAALLTERDVLRGAGVEADLGVRLDLLRGLTHRADAEASAIRHIRAEARLCQRAAGGDQGGASGPVSPGLLVALAYPDRIAQRRPGEAPRYLLRNGQGAALEPQALTRESYLAVADTDGQPRESRIFRAAAVTLEELEIHFANDIVTEDVVGWDNAEEMVLARRQRRLGALVLGDVPLTDPDPEVVTRVYTQGIRSRGVGRLPWSEPARRLRERLTFLHRLEPGWPDVGDEALTRTLEEWLGPRVRGLRRLAELERVDLGAALLELLDSGARARLDALAPTHLPVPSGSRIQVGYEDPGAPVLAVRLQELFGLGQTPTVGGGRVPVTLHLLSPAGRPVQVTRDLAGFWGNTYFEVRRDLRGRYPKHHWPDDPLEAAPTRHAKRRPPGGT